MEAGKEEQRRIVRVLTDEGVGGREIHRRMAAVYGVPCSRVLKWHKRFREGRVPLQDDTAHPPARFLPMRCSILEHRIKTFVDIVLHRTKICETE